ncbi:P-loop NTPase fold protein [Streptomyces sp. NPDC056544]|uniref:P-loop NTPase fold protein n=1 Tax=unclassified Streptomyces TaxID=2593676 RepID=UPI0036B4A9EF
MSNDQTTPRQSLVSAYTPDFFTSTESWERLHGILSRGKGGSIGLSGPRGAGKSWLMGRAIDWASHNNGIGIWFPSPSEYDPIAFMASLSEVSATKFQEYYDATTKATSRIARKEYVRRYSFGSILLMIGSLFLLRYIGWAGIDYIFWLQVGVAVIISGTGLTIMWGAAVRLRSSRRGIERVHNRAIEMRIQIRFALTAKDSAEIDAKAGKWGLAAHAKRAKERQLVERPSTLSSLVHNFREFVGEMDTALDGPILILIDELDKMIDPERVTQLLRDIKGAFEIRGVYTLVSISDEAAKYLELGAIKTRNEFNSSFSTALSIPPLSPDEAATLLRQRCEHFDRDAGRALGILTGGNPREVVRLGDTLAASGVEHLTFRDAIFHSLRDELAAFLDDAIREPNIPRASWGPLINEHNPPPQRLAAFSSVPKEALRDIEVFSNFSARSLTLWGEDAGGGFDVEFIEEWRRLLTRLACSHLLLLNSALHINDALHLQEIVRIAENSATAARLRLVGYFLSKVGVKPEGAIPEADTCVVSLLLGKLEESFRWEDSPPGREWPYRNSFRKLERRGIIESHRKWFSRRWKVSDQARRRLSHTSRSSPSE